MIEILAGMAIIAVLAVLLFGMSTKVMESGKRAKCISNLRQIGAALMSYAADHNQDLPPQYWWSRGAAPPALTAGDGPNGLGFLVTEGYLGQATNDPTGPRKPLVLRCPSKSGSNFFDGGGNWSSYVYENPISLPGGDPDPGRPNKTINLRAGWALVIDAPQVFSAQEPAHGTAGKFLTNVLYGDGHVESRPFQDNSSWGKTPSQFDLSGTPRE